MKIKEVLELTQTMTIATIAKQIDGISEKPLRALLREVGCVHYAGKKGWEYEGNDPEILGRSIFDFHKPKANRKRTSERKNQPSKEQKYDTIKEQSQEPTNQSTKEKTHIMRKRASFDIETDLLKELKIFAIKEDKNVYEVVEQAIKDYIRGK